MPKKTNRIAARKRNTGRKRPEPEEILSLTGQGRGGLVDPRVNEHGCYIADVEKLTVPLAASSRAQLSVRLVQDVDGWRAASDFNSTIGGWCGGPFVHDSRYATRAAALRAVIEETLAKLATLRHHNPQRLRSIIRTVEKFRDGLPAEVAVVPVRSAALPPAVPALNLTSNEAAPEDRLAWWTEQYLTHAVTTAPSSRAVQRRDLAAFVRFAEEAGAPCARGWSPRLSRSFLDHLRSTRRPDGARAWSDRTIQRIMAHLKRFARWVHSLAPLPLGDPVQELRLPAAAPGGGLELERAITDDERRRLLDAADLLPQVQGRSRDRRRARGRAPADRPRRISARPWRNRAVVYCLIETGMRRAAVVALDETGIDWERGSLTVREKGGADHTYAISRQGLAALADYARHERPADAAAFLAAASFFLPASSRVNSRGRLAAGQVNRIWSEVGRLAGVSARSPHSARHAMGRRLIAATGNIAAVQRQLGHRNVAYSVQYARITEDELHQALEENS